MKKEDLVADDGYFVENNRILLRLTSKTDEENYMKQVIDSSTMKAAYECDIVYDFTWNRVFQTDFMNLTILDKKTSDYIGYINIRPLSNEIPELGIDIVEKHRREGFGYNAVRLVTEQIKLRAGCRTFMVCIYADNTASLSMFHKFPLIEVGREESEYITAIKSLYQGQDPSAFQKFKEQIAEKWERESQRTIIKYHLKV